MAHVDCKIDNNEQRLLTHFLNCSQLEKDAKLKMEFYINNGINKSNFNISTIQNPLLLGITF